MKFDYFKLAEMRKEVVKILNNNIEEIRQKDMEKALVYIKEYFPNAYIDRNIIRDKSSERPNDYAIVMFWDEIIDNSCKLAYENKDFAPEHIFKKVGKDLKKLEFIKEIDMNKLLENFIDQLKDENTTILSKNGYDEFWIISKNGIETLFVFFKLYIESLDDVVVKAGYYIDNMQLDKTLSNHEFGEFRYNKTKTACTYDDWQKEIANKIINFAQTGDTSFMW